MKLFAYLVILVLAPHILHAQLYEQLPQYLSPLTTDQGLSSGRYNNYIFQDSRGLIWINSTSGLNLFDGHRNHVFRADPNEENGLLTDRASLGEFQEDRWGNIWISNAKCLLRYNPTLDSFQRIFLPHPDTLKGDIVEGYFFMKLNDAKNQLYAIANEHLFVLDLSKYSYTYRFVDHFDRNAKDKMFSFQGESMDYLAFANYADGLLWIEYDDDTKCTNDKFFDTPSGARIYDAWRDEQRTAWLASSNGLYALNYYTEKFEHFHLDGASNQGGVLRIKPIGSDSLLIASEEGNVYVFNREDKAYEGCFLQFDNNTCLPFSENISNLNVDCQDNFWINLQGQGIRHGHLGKTKFSQFGIDEDGAPLGIVNAILEDRHSELWTLHPREVRHFSADQIDIFELPIEGKANEQSTFIYENDHFDLWVGTLDSLLFKGQSEDRFRKISFKVNDRLLEKSPGFHDLLSLPDGKTLLSGNEGQVYLIDSMHLTNGCLQAVVVKNSCRNVRNMEINPQSILATYSLSDSLMIASYQNGVLAVDTVFTNLPFVSSIEWDEDRSRFWLSTYDGLQYIEADEMGKWHIRKREYLAEPPMLESLVLDHCGEIWMTARGQIIHFKPEQDKTYTYSTNDGLQGTEFVTNASLTTRDGQIYFGGTEGVNCFRPAEVHPKMPMARPGITGIVINEDPTLFWQYNGGGSKNPLDSQRLILPDDVSLIELYLSAREYSAPTDCQFKFLLEGGRNDDWVELGNSPMISLPNLAFGNYKLLVKATNSEGIWSRAVHTLYFRIRPPIFARLWFILIAFGLIGLFVFILVDRSRRKKTKQLVEIANVETALERLMLKPHVLFNGLAATKRLIHKGQAVEAENYLGRFSDYMRNLMDNGKREMIALDDEIGLLEDYIKIEQLRMPPEQRFRYELDMAEDFDPFDYQVPILLLQPFVENAVVHGLRGLGQAGIIRISLAHEKAILHINIRDNGIGRASTRQKSQAEAKNHNGIATPTTRRRIKLMNKLAGRGVISFVIEDLVNEAGEAKGTSVHFELDAAYFNQLANEEAARLARQAEDQRPGRTT